MTEKAFGLLGLMRRAGALAIGEDNSLEAIRCGKAKLLLLASDVSSNARRRAENVSEGRNLEQIPLDCTREEMGSALGLASCSMAVVTDLGFAGALSAQLAEENPETFGEIAQRVRVRSEKASRRKAQKGTKRVGTRRTNV